MKKKATARPAGTTSRQSTFNFSTSSEPTSSPSPPLLQPQRNRARVSSPTPRSTRGQLIQSFTAKPKAPASTKAGACGWAVNRNPLDATKLELITGQFALFRYR